MGPSMFVYCVTCTMSLLLCTTGSFSYQIFYFTCGTFNISADASVWKIWRLSLRPWNRVFSWLQLFLHKWALTYLISIPIKKHIWLSSIVRIIDVCTLMHMLYFRLNFQCQRFRKPSTSSGIVICQNLQRCVILSSFSGLLKLFTNQKDKEYSSKWNMANWISQWL
jgi:hypothetical protein